MGHPASPAAASLEFWADAMPTETAIIEGDRALTYRQWDDAANRLAEALAERGLGSADIVVVRLQIRVEWAIVAAALGKLGCSLLALNWRLTPAELQHVLANSGARALICDDPEPQRLLSAMTSLPLKLLVSIDTPAPGFLDFSQLLEGPLKQRFAARDPHLIVYTSGTTGLPKGVVMGAGSPHFSAQDIEEYVTDVRSGRTSGIANARTLVTMPMHHGSGPSQLWAALHAKRPIVLLRRFDPERALALIQHHAITDWGSVPTMLKRMAALPQHILTKYDVSSIRHISVGAAPVPYSLKEWVLGHFGENCLTEGYGSTETGMVTRLPPSMQRAKPGSSGLPYRHVQIDIRGPDRLRLGAGETGEIWVRTPLTLQRYVNGAELGLDQLDADGFFRVGDVGYRDADGFLFITDRAKDLIISGGVNIYPAEIEKLLLRHPAIFDVAVIGVPDEEFGEQVCAIVELKPGAVLLQRDLESFIAGDLASYKRPRRVEFVAELPRNTMGKVLKRQLRDERWKDQEKKI